MAKRPKSKGSVDPERSAAMKGNQNAKGSHGKASKHGAKIGAIGTGLFGPIGSLGAGMYVGAKKDDRAKNRQRKASGIVGAAAGATGMVGYAALAGAATGGKLGAAAGGVTGALTGAVVGGTLNYAASAIGQRIMQSQVTHNGVGMGKDKRASGPRKKK